VTEARSWGGWGLQGKGAAREIQYEHITPRVPFEMCRRSQMTDVPINFVRGGKKSGPGRIRGLSCRQFMQGMGGKTA
jgi:hypothetical protein